MKPNQLLTLISALPTTGLLVVLILTGACTTQWSEKEQHFVETYVEILVVREQFPDTAIANPKVRHIQSVRGYTEESFREQFVVLTKDPDRFRQTIDSARQVAKDIVANSNRRDSTVSDSARDSQQNND